MPVQAAYDFHQAIQPISGAFFDATLALKGLVPFIDSRSASLPASPLIVPFGAPRDDTNDTIAYMTHDFEGNRRLVHAARLRELRRRNQPDGQNTIQLGNACAIAIFAHWEHRYRGAITSEVGLPKDKPVEVALFGDLRLLRIALIHTFGVLGAAHAKLEVVTWASPNEPVAFDEGRFIWLMRAIEEFVHNADALRPS
jgi:hypothetical protein